MRSLSPAEHLRGECKGITIIVRRGLNVHGIDVRMGSSYSTSLSSHAAHVWSSFYKVFFLFS